MKEIKKFELAVQDDQDIALPADHTFLSVISKNNRPVIYALVDPTSHSSKARVRLIPTGLRFEDDHLQRFDFLGTVMTEDPLAYLKGTKSNYTFVWHIFVERRWP